MMDKEGKTGAGPGGLRQRGRGAARAARGHGAGTPRVCARPGSDPGASPRTAAGCAGRAAWEPGRGSAQLGSDPGRVPGGGAGDRYGDESRGLAAGARGRVRGRRAPAARRSTGDAPPPAVLQRGRGPP